jgi:U4/U6 small nuclear ribonucleoprotein PRP4
MTVINLLRSSLHSRPLFSWSVNGFELATGGDDGTVKIWDLRARKIKETVPAHAGLISCVKFSPSSSELLLTSSYDGKVKIFNTRNWRCIKTLEGHSGQVTGVDMNDAEDTIVSSGFDKTFKVWRCGQ